MTPSKLILLLVPVSMMIAVCIGLKGSETWLAHFGNSAETQQALGQTSTFHRARLNACAGLQTACRCRTSQKLSG